ncbi:hypothetical protein [Brevibacterium antiquum]|uniref:hypothetical protein n=1 Tax=Brevibacterium antiquum TaxID=234835 RepID=UPI0011AF6B35|nr:hypothetical protein [Brevibacterium antiquum]
MALHGLAPRFPIVFLYSAFMALFGHMLRFGQRILDMSLFDHIGQYPVQDPDTTAIALPLGAAVVLPLGAAVVLIDVGIAGFCRRGIPT